MMAADSKESLATVSSGLNVLLPPSAFAQMSDEFNYGLPSKNSVPETRKFPAEGTDIEALPPRTSPSKRKSKQRSTHRSHENYPRDVDGKENFYKTEAIEEIEKLKTDFYKLREENLKTTYEFLIGDHMRQQTGTGLNTHIETLLQKQSEEILSLKQQLLSTHANFEKQKGALMAEFSVKEKEYLRAIEEARENAQKNASEFVAQYQSEYHKLQAQLTEASNVRVALQSQLISRDETIQKISAEVQELRNKLESLTSQIRGSQAEAESKDAVIKSLRLQLGVLQKNEADKVSWPATKVELETKISSLEDNRDSLKNEIEYLNHRFTAISNILAVQQDSLRDDTDDITSQDKIHSLLNRWRTKVFQMLVQQKSSELAQRKQDSQQEECFLAQKQQIRSLGGQLKELQGINQDLQGQLLFYKKQKQSLESSLIEAKKEIKELLKFKDAILIDCDKLFGVLSGSKQRFDEQSRVLEKVYTKMAEHESRLICASKLLNGCQQPMKSLKMNRDDLSKQLSANTELNNTLKEKLSDQEHRCEDSAKKVEELQKSLLNIHTQNQQKETLIGQLKNEIDTLTSHKELESKRLKMEAEKDFRAKLDEYERNIADLKKELAKTIVALRQSERQRISDSNRYTEGMKAVAKENSSKISRIQTDLTTAQTEKAVLQSNLVAAFAVKDRMKPVAGSTDTSPVKSPTKSLHNSPSTAHSPLDALIGSVKKLAASVLSSDNSDSDCSDVL